MSKSWMVRSLIACMALFLLGEDVERPPIEIYPPDQTADLAPKDPLAETGSGQQLGIVIPRRLKLELPIGLDPSEHPDLQYLSEAERISKRIDDYLLCQAAIRKAQTGSVDPGWHYLSRSMERAFRPQFNQVNDPTTEISWAWMRNMIWNWLDEWHKSAGARRDTRAPLARIDPQYLADTTILELQRAAIQDRQFGTTITSLVEIRFQKDGTLTAKLVSSSGHAQFDRQAMQAAQKATQAPKQLELPEGPGRALYALSARYSILPPLPVVGFGFDIMLGYSELFYPFKKMVSGRANLVAVFD